MMCDELFRHVMNYKGTNAKRKINDVAMIMQKYVGVTTTHGQEGTCSSQHEQAEGM